MSNSLENPQAQQQVSPLFAPLTDDERARDVSAITLTIDEWHPETAPSEPERPHGASSLWVYRDKSGAVIYARVRFDQTDLTGKATKSIRPYTYGRRVWTDQAGQSHDETRWHFKQPAKPLPLYGLDRLAVSPEKVVLLVEGEKTADHAQTLFPDMVAITSGGSTSAPSVDWTPLAGRSVVIWPDNDEAGQSYAQAATDALMKAGALLVRLVRVPSYFPEKWDLADTPPAELSCELGQLIEQAKVTESSVTMPRGYSMSKNGLYYTPEAKGDDMPSPVWVCAPFDVIASTRDEQSMSWGLLIRWRDPDNVVHQWSIPKELVHSDGTELAGGLERGGLVCSPSQHTKLKLFIASVKTKARLKCVNRPGWHQTERGFVFVLPDGSVFGAGGDAIAYQIERVKIGAEYTPKGTLQEWQSNIAAYTSGNNRLMFVLCAAFSGPLLDIAGEQSGGFHIVGDSQTGKSTALFCAGSVWGRGDRSGQVRSWRSTANGTEGIAEETSATILLLDEINLANGRDVGDTIYMLANEVGKQRAGRNGEARERKTWRSSFISTGEATLADKMAEDGKKIMAGQEVRLINISADAGAGMGFFEKLNGFTTPSEFADYFKRAATISYGTAGRAFLEALTQGRENDEPALMSVINKIRDQFIKDCLPDGATNGQVSSVIKRFALAAAAGELATAYKILPWEDGDATRAAQVCFKAWLDNRGSTGTAEDAKAIEQVRAFIEAHGESRFTAIGRNTPPDEQGYNRTHNRAGYKRIVETMGGSLWQYLILPKQWSGEVCKGLNPTQAAKALLAAGYLTPDKEGSNTQKIRTSKSETARVYVISGKIIEGE